MAISRRTLFWPALLIGLFCSGLWPVHHALARGGGGSHSSSHTSAPKGSDVHVNGYTTKNGTYVQPHLRSAPDGLKNNNWSKKGNINPYTGKAGTKARDASEDARTGDTTSSSPSTPHISHGAAVTPAVVTPSRVLRPPPPRFSLPGDPIRRSQWRGVSRALTTSQARRGLGTPTSITPGPNGTEDWHFADGAIRFSHGTAIAWSPRTPTDSN